MDKTMYDKTIRLLAHTSFLCAALSFGLYLAIVFFRFSYPFELEWLEGCILDHVRRILHGEQLYVRPSLEFVPFLYTPLYYYVGAALSAVAGDSLVTLRVISILCSLACFWLVYRIVAGETGNWRSGLLAAGLLAASFRMTGAWFDLARVDSMFLFWLLGAVYWLTRGTRRDYLLAGLFLALSYFTKQVALFAAGPILLHAFVVQRKNTLYLAGVLVVSLAAGSAILEYLHDGWYSFYVFSLPRSHPLEMRGLERMLPLLWLMPIACLISLYCLLPSRKTGNAHFSGKGKVHMGMLIGMGTATVFSCLHTGAYDNALMPLCAGVSILFGLGMGRGIQFGHGLGGTVGFVFQGGLYCLCVVQFALLAYDPVEQIPTVEDEKAGIEWLNVVKGVPGDVLIPRHGYLATMAGKGKAFAHEMAMTDVMRGDSGSVRQALVNDIIERLSTRSFGAIITDYDWLRSEIAVQYREGPAPYRNKDVFWPVTGTRTRPEQVFLPRLDNSR